MAGRAIPLILIATPLAAFADSVATQLRREGSVVYIAHTPEGCLRVATSAAPDVVLLDPSFPSRLEKLLKAHPATADAQVLHLSMIARPSFSLPRTHAAA